MKPDKKPLLIGATVSFGLSVGFSLGVVLSWPSKPERIAACVIGVVALFVYLSVLVEYVLDRLDK